MSCKLFDDLFSRSVSRQSCSANPLVHPCSFWAQADMPSALDPQIACGNCVNCAWDMVGAVLAQALEPNLGAHPALEFIPSLSFLQGLVGAAYPHSSTLKRLTPHLPVEHPHFRGGSWGSDKQSQMSSHSLYSWWHGPTGALREAASSPPHSSAW